MAQVLSAILQVLYTKHSMEAKTFFGSDPSISNERPKHKAEISEMKKLLSTDSKVTGLPKAEGGRTFSALKHPLSPHCSVQLRAVCYGQWKSPFPVISHPLMNHLLPYPPAISFCSAHFSCVLVKAQKKVFSTLSKEIVLSHEMGNEYN